jgi:hypothetical protein
MCEHCSPCRQLDCRFARPAGESSALHPSACPVVGTPVGTPGCTTYNGQVHRSSLKQRRTAGPLHAVTGRSRVGRSCGDRSFARRALCGDRSFARTRSSQCGTEVAGAPSEPETTVCRWRSTLRPEYHSPGSLSPWWSSPRDSPNQRLGDSALDAGDGVADAERNNPPMPDAGMIADAGPEGARPPALGPQIGCPPMDRLQLLHPSICGRAPSSHGGQGSPPSPAEKAKSRNQPDRVRRRDVAIGGAIST